MSEWQPIKTAPKDGRWMLLAMGWPHEDWLYVGRWNASKHPFVWQLMNETDIEHGVSIADSAPTHWMPVPQKPSDSVSL